MAASNNIAFIRKLGKIKDHKKIKKLIRLASKDEMKSLVDGTVRLLRKEIPVRRKMKKEILRNRRILRHVVHPAYSLNSKKRYLIQKGGAGFGSLFTNIAKAIGRAPPAAAMTGAARTVNAPGLRFAPAVVNAPHAIPTAPMMRTVSAPNLGSIPTVSYGPRFRIPVAPPGSGTRPLAPRPPTVGQMYHQYPTPPSVGQASRLYRGRVGDMSSMAQPRYASTPQRGQRQVNEWLDRSNFERLPTRDVGPIRRLRYGTLGDPTSSFEAATTPSRLTGISRARDLSSVRIRDPTARDMIRLNRRRARQFNRESFGLRSEHGSADYQPTGSSLSTRNIRPDGTLDYTPSASRLSRRAARIRAERSVFGEPEYSLFGSTPRYDGGARGRDPMRSLDWTPQSSRRSLDSLHSSAPHYFGERGRDPMRSLDWTPQSSRRSSMFSLSTPRSGTSFDSVASSSRYGGSGTSFDSVASSSRYGTTPSGSYRTASSGRTAPSSYMTDDSTSIYPSTLSSYRTAGDSSRSSLYSPYMTENSSYYTGISGPYDRMKPLPPLPEAGPGILSRVGRSIRSGADKAAPYILPAIGGGIIGGSVARAIFEEKPKPNTKLADNKPFVEKVDINMVPRKKVTFEQERFSEPSRPRPQQESLYYDTPTRTASRRLFWDR